MLRAFYVSSAVIRILVLCVQVHVCARVCTCVCVRACPMHVCWGECDTTPSSSVFRNLESHGFCRLEIWERLRWTDLFCSLPLDCSQMLAGASFFWSLDWRISVHVGTLTGLASWCWLLARHLSASLQGCLSVLIAWWLAFPRGSNSRTEGGRPKAEAWWLSSNWTGLGVSMWGYIPGREKNIL